MSLRAELIAPTELIPGFAILLPEGWGSFDGDQGALRGRLTEALAALTPAQRTLLAPRLEELVATAAENAEAGMVIRTFAQQSTPADAFLPLSLVASRLEAPVGSTIAALGAQLIAANGAAPLDETGTILRWSTTSQTRVDDAAIAIETVNYLLPVPERPTRGLLFQAGILRGADGAAVDEDGITAMSALCDAIVSTVRWRRDA